jgi:hypothetical protein
MANGALSLCSAARVPSIVRSKITDIRLPNKLRCKSFLANRIPDLYEFAMKSRCDTFGICLDKVIS